MATASDVMTASFHTVGQDVPISEAIRQFESASEQEKRRVFGMMVTDDAGKLVGIISMYDILLFIRPKHIHLWGTMQDIDVSGIMETMCAQARSVRVGDIMSTDVVSVTPDTHLMAVLNLMIRKHVRRLPVVTDQNIRGIVYISDVFRYIADNYLSTTP
jgi:CBS domain-containing protein